MGATAQVDVADPVALLHQPLYSLVCNVHTVAQVHVMKILAQASNGEDGLICNVTALGENNVPKTWRSIDDLLDSSVGDSKTRREIDNAQMLKGPTRRERKKGAFVHQFAAGQTKFPKTLTLEQERGHGRIPDQLALLEVNFKNIGTIYGESLDGIVADLIAVVQFEL